VAIAVMVDTPGMTAEHFERTSEKLNLANGLPEGCLVQLAGPGPEGWRILSVWESPEKAQQFVATMLNPAQAELGIALVNNPPVAWEVYSLQMESRPVAAGKR
jgi:hypothetical protein